jgi:hypothetical protein
MEENTDEVRIRIGKKTKVLRGKEAEIALRAMQYILDTVKSHKKIKIDIVDTGLPKNFSYARTIDEAIKKKHLDNPIEVAEYILKKLRKASHTIS